TLVEGATVSTAGWTLQALHTPGHSPGHLTFHDVERGALFSGDVVLEGKGTPVQSYDLDGREGPISDLVASTERIGALGAKRGFPGHGDPFSDLPAEVRRVRDHHERRLAWLTAFLGTEPRTVWDAALEAPWRSAWSDLAAFAQLLALGKIGAQFATLERRG